MSRSEVEVLKSDMPTEMKNFIIDQVDDTLREYNADSSRPIKLESLVTQLGRTLKQRYEGVWQVVILTGSYSAFSAYTPERLFHFKFGRFVVLVWQSSTY
ncbi:hypothetical protein ECG_06274 [Echinococcus granulosus]|uniref:Tegumental protein n=2 Tax=Echinococcus granulosus TaxID=6210 RepID=W6U648_ECHGR|nr:tegumental protein [Echinococcus granulosus]EUB56610.1 tegumental protein [Echinococcus granulosus]KAH9280470.1 hypothetical protein ECG_06274 [Echinococcus granulosus]